MKIFLSGLLLLAATTLAISAPVTLAENGKAKLAIILSKDASETSLKNAKTLAAYLQKISGADFEIRNGDGSEGIVFGKAVNFSKTDKETRFDPKNFLRTEEFIISSAPNKLLLLGA